MMKLKLMVIIKKPSAAKQRACGVRGQGQDRGQSSDLSFIPAHRPLRPSHQDLGGGLGRLLLSGHDAEVEDGREDEDEARGRRGTCEQPGMVTEGSRPPTGQAAGVEPSEIQQSLLGEILGGPPAPPLVLCSLGWKASSLVSEESQ